MKGKKSIKNEGDLWEEPKSKQVRVVLTATAFELLKSQCDQSRISRSEAIERCLRASSNHLLDERRLTYGEILRSLPNLSHQILLDVGYKAIALARKKLSAPSNSVLPVLLEDVDLQSLSESSLILIEELKSLANGDREPTQGERIQLAAGLGIEYNDLEKLIDGQIHKAAQ